MSNHRLTYDMLARQSNGRLTPLIIAGPPGGGKTHLGMSLCGPNEPFCRIPVAGLVKEELGVQPVPEKIDGDWLVQQPIVQQGLLDLLEHKIGDGYGVVMFDDVTAADPSIQNALLEISQFGTIGGKKLGINVAVVMTGNGVSDGAYANQWSTALINRSHFISFKPSLEVWKELDENKFSDPIIYGFLMENEKSFAPEVSVKDDRDKFFDSNNRCPSPRSWSTLANSTMEKWGGLQNFQPSILFPTPASYIGSLVGDKVGVMLGNYASIMIKYPSSQELMQDPGAWLRKTTPEQRNQMAAVYAVAHSLRQTMIKENDRINDKHGGPETKGKAAEKEKDELIKKFCYAVAAMMGTSRELGAFTFRYVLQNVDQKDIVKGLMSNYVFGIGNADPVLREAGFDKILKDIQDMDSAVRGTPSPGN